MEESVLVDYWKNHCTKNRYVQGLQVRAQMLTTKNRQLVFQDAAQKAIVKLRSVWIDAH